ncbi:hypothetical protein VTL71DRAFT_14440 [Oculimacula yallundae]|uniref:Cytochrome P450 n=1 Tax=Oculimacula yallundae TaxID=86028 RepID=A0ABR4CIG8_9HELO
MLASGQSYSVHHNPKAFPNAEEWFPERWDLPSDVALSNEMARHFWPFGSGQRICISMHIAWAELRLVVARLFSTYDLSLGDAYLGPDKKISAEADRQHLFPYTAQEPLCLERISIDAKDTQVYYYANFKCKGRFRSQLRQYDLQICIVTLEVLSFAEAFIVHTVDKSELVTETSSQVDQYQKVSWLRVLCHLASSNVANSVSAPILTA